MVLTQTTILFSSNLEIDPSFINTLKTHGKYFLKERENPPMHNSQHVNNNKRRTINEFNAKHKNNYMLILIKT